MEKIILKLLNSLKSKIWERDISLRFIFLLLIVLSIGFSSKTKAVDWSHSTHFKTKWDVETGLMRIDIMYFDEDGGPSNSNAGYSPAGGWLRMSFEAGDTLDITGKDTENNPTGFSKIATSSDKNHNPISVVTSGWNWDKGGEYRSNENSDVINNSGRERWVYLYWKVPSNKLNSSTSIFIEGKWWRRGSGVDVDFGQQYLSAAYMGANISSITINSVEHTMDSYNKPAVKVSWSKSGSSSNADNLGNIYLREEGSSTNLASVKANEGRSGTFYLDASPSGKVNLNKTTKYVVVQEYVPTGNNRLKYTKQSNTATLSAFPQVKKDSFKASFDSNTNLATLSWSVDIDNDSNYIGDKKFRLRGDGNSLVNRDEPYVKGQKDYIYSFDVPSDIDKTYKFSINRFNVPAWDTYYKRTVDLYVQPKHISATNLRASLVSNKEALIEWNAIGTAWSSGARATLTRINLTNGTSEDITLTKDDLLKGKYSDTFIQICRRYQYKITIIPANEYESIPVIYSAEEITPVEIGSISDLQVSKGYFADRTELSWKSEGRFDNFRIRRVEYGKLNADTILVATVSDLGSGNVLAEDTKGSSGVYYTYLVEGIVICDGEKKYSNLLTSVGFRSQTGSIYGRITYENGQAVPHVDVLLESDLPQSGKSILFNGTDAFGEIAKNIALNDSNFTLQAWVAPTDASPTGTILSKDGEYELALANGAFRFKVGTVEVSAPYEAPAGVSYTHVTAVKRSDSLTLYINGKFAKSETISAGTNTSANPTFIGKNSSGNFFKGNIDEVRVWNEALDSATIVRDYSRLLYGGEKGLKAYWRFNEGVAGEFYDISYDGNIYHANHGTLLNAFYSTSIPLTIQLTLKGISNTDGNYTISGIPFAGQGTMYRVVPRMGTHRFDPVEQQRLISSGSLTHTCDFTDKSSFRVSGFVYYSGGTVPVKDVSFEIDGLPASANNRPVLTDAAGKFTINVPVGIHDVRVVKHQHMFENDGRITNSDSTNVNYQDNIEMIKLYDKTKVKFIGRVAGGAVQEAYPLGHSLSKNNLSDKVTITMSLVGGQGKEIVEKSKSEIVEHKKVRGLQTTHSTKVDYSAGEITITPDVKTGEFEAWVIPENFNITSVNVGGDYGNILVSGRSENIDLTNMLTKKEITYQYVDTVSKPNKTYNDTINYHYSHQFIKRLTPSISITQTNSESFPYDYFGEKEIGTTSITGVYGSIPVITEDNHYLFDLPLFQQGKKYYIRANVFEEFKYYDSQGLEVTGKVDKVPTTDGIVSFANALRDGSSNPDTVSISSKGIADYSFIAGSPNLTSNDASKSMGVSVKIGTTSIPGTTLQGIIIGGVPTGTNFVTAGPNIISTVLRDPPGSHSYSYIEKGAKIENNIKAHWGVDFNQEIGVISYAGLKAATVTGIGVASAIETDLTFENKFTAKFSETVDWEKGVTTTMETTSRWETSSDPQFVGPEGDVYIGNATNITTGKINSITLVKNNEINEIATPLKATANYTLVRQAGLGVGINFSTGFAYPQKHIENVLIPELENMIKNILLPKEVNIADVEAAAERDQEPKYVSMLENGDPNFGKLNSDSIAFGNRSQKAANEKAPSYRIIYPKSSTNERDTILAIVQWIKDWKREIAMNEMAKVTATDGENISFHGGSKVEKSNTYSQNNYKSLDFEFVGGAIQDVNFNSIIGGAGVRTVLNLETTSNAGNLEESSEEESATFGFVLEESGNDYISVDVKKVNMLRVYDKLKSTKAIDEDRYNQLVEAYKKVNHNEYVFLTRAGATSCPYEGEYIAKYFEPGSNHIINQATARVEVPIFDVENGKNIVSNVPSTRKAVYRLVLQNGSETNTDRYYDLYVNDATNPDGASFFVDGAPLGNGRTVFVPAGTTIIKTLEVGKGTAMDYENIVLVLGSQCDEKVYDEVSISAHFVPSCSDVKISLPNDKWTLNAETPNITADNKYFLPITLTDFDVNYTNFDHIAIQYKPSAASDADWVTLVKYYADDAKYNAAQGSKAKITGSSINYQFIMGDLADQKYDIAAVSVCSLPTGNIETVSNIVSGIKDTYRPRLFGSAQPANGILGIADEIRLNFNELIAAGYLTDNNFEVTGTRIGEIITHAASVKFDGSSDYLSTEALRNLTDKSFTVEMGLYRDNANQNATIFSHGNLNNSFEIGITADKKVKVKVGETTVVSDNAANMKDGEWEHLAVVYLSGAQPRVQAFYNLVQVIDKPVPAYNGVGIFEVGRSMTSGEHFNGKISELRVWDRALTMASLNKNKNTSLQGSEVGLSTYFPMNEGRGEVVTDKARGANAAMNARWFINRDGYAAQFDGNSYLKLSTGSLPISNEMDYTVEFWFKGEPGQTNASLVSNGRGDNEEEGGSLNKLNIGVDAQGKLAVTANGFTKTADGTFLDNSWHHFALAVNRNNGRASIFIDGKLNTYFDSGNLGRVQAASMLLGARGWYAKGNAATEIIDNYFKGKIDEFRIWNTYKNETMVHEENNVSLKGSEMGLLTYYPFETYNDWQGRLEMQFSLADKTIRGANGAVIPDAENKGAIADKVDVAPVKERGPRTPIAINYVVNNDALIITPAAPSGWNDFEQTIVTFKAKNIQDLNGNKMVSPVSWTAYIDRNQLNWGESELNLDKKVYEPYTFEVKIVNKGGSDQTYSIENAPAWLKVTPNKGTITPKSSQTIKFVVNEGLNVGYYSEQLYLVNGDGVARALALNMRVKGDEPTWTVNPSDYKYSMSVFGKLRVNNIYSTSKDDILAAFKDGKCIGVTKNVYKEDMDLWYTFLTIYGNEKQSGPIEFRMWDSNTGKIFSAVPDREIPFVNDGIVGSPNAPVIFNGKEIVYQNIPLKSGWNWISLNTTPANIASVNAVLSNGEWTSEDVVKSLNFFDSYSKESKSWIGTLSNNGGFNNTNMFMLHSAKEQTLSVAGALVKTQNVSLPIKGGYWNYISYLPGVNYTVKEALTGYDASVGDVIKSQTKFAMFSGKEWVGDLAFMEPGKGYMLQRKGTNDVSFTYPSIRGTLSNMPARINSELSSEYVNRDYSETMNIIATSKDIRTNDRILTYVNGELRGISNMIQAENGELSFINIAGTSNEGTITFVLERNNTEIARTASTLRFNANSVVGTLEKPHIINFDNTENLVSVYPSLFDQKLNVELTNIQVGDKIEIELVEVASGRVIFKQAPLNAQSQYYNLTISSQENNIVSGVYLMNVKINEVTSAHKVVKK